MAQSVQHIPSSNDVLQPIEGNLKWSGAIWINFLDNGNAAETARFSSSETFQGSSSNFAGLPGSWRVQFMSVVNAFSDVANINVQYTSDINANYLIGDINEANVGGFFDFPGSPANGNTLVGGLNTSEPAMNVFAELGGGNFRQYNFLHEFGHALGLAHPFDDGLGTSIVGSIFDGPSPYTAVHTVMSYDISKVDNLSYTSAYGFAVTPMALDIAALQSMYGATSSHHSGDTKYSLLQAGGGGLDTDGNNGSVAVGRAYYCIWDTGGNDEITHTTSSSALINLNAATLTDETSPDVLAWLQELQSTAAWEDLLSEKTRAEITDPDYQAGGFFSSLLDSDGNRVAGGYTIANGAVIENATGGSNDDILIGNGAANKLFGGYGGDDILIGGGGNDFLEAGQGGADILLGGNGDDHYMIYAHNYEHMPRSYNLHDTAEAFLSDFDLTNFGAAPTINDSDGNGNIELYFTTDAYYNINHVDVSKFFYAEIIDLSQMHMSVADERLINYNTIYEGITGNVWEYTPSVVDYIDAYDGSSLQVASLKVQAAMQDGHLYLWTESALIIREPHETGDGSIDEYIEQGIYVEVGKIENFSSGDLGVFLA